MRVAALIALLAASAAAAPQFEAATFRQAEPPAGNYPITLGLRNGSRLTFTNVTLADCLKYAWGLVSNEQITGPSWIRSTDNLFDIVAVIPPDAPQELLMQMMQTLLAERVGLAVHHEDKEMKYLALVVDKGQIKMPAADTSEERRNSGGRGALTGNRVSMGLMALLLSRLERQVVIDKTGLGGEYQVKLRWAPGSSTADTAPADDSSLPSLFAAVQEQLGLKLESRKSPVDSIVVDRANRVPADN